MKYATVFRFVVVCLCLVIPAVSADDAVGKAVKDVWPDLPSGILTWARCAPLPSPVWVQGPGFQVTADDFEKALDDEPLTLEKNFRENAFYLVEELVAKKVLHQLSEDFARKTSLPKNKDPELAFLEHVARDVTVSEDECRAFFDAHKLMFAGDTFEDDKQEIHDMLLEERQDEAVKAYIRNLGRQVPLKVSVSWAAKRAAAFAKNPIERLRGKGKVLLVGFSTPACSCCTTAPIQPVLDKIKREYADRVSVLYIDVRQNPVLCDRYGIKGIPTWIFYGPAGKEYARVQQDLYFEDINARLKKMGIE